MDMTMFRRRGLLLNTPHIVNESGSIVTFDSAYNKVPIKRLICNIDPIQSGSGDPSPDNVRPISGRTGLSVVRYGKNLLPTTVPSNAIAGSFNTSSTKIVTATNGRTFAIPVPKNTDLFVQKITGDTSSGGIALCDTGSIAVGTPIFNPAPFSGTVNATINTGDHGWLCIATGTQQSMEDWWTTRELMISVGTERQEYVAPSGYSEVSVNWETEAGAVYGGTFDVVSGKLIVDRGYSKLSDLTSWGTDSNLNNGTMRAVISNVLKPGSSVVTTAIMDCRKAVAYGPLQPTWTTSFAISYEGKVVIPMNRAITVAEFLSEYGNHEVCYPLATPTEIQLTPQEVKTLLGENNIWCDSGEVSVDYWKWGN